MPKPARHMFKSEEPVDLFSEQLRFYVELRGKKYHKVMPMPQTLVSDVRQLAEHWTAVLLKLLELFKSGLATAWKGIFQGWQSEVDLLAESQQSPTDVYERNVPFWLALRKLALQLGAADQIMTRREVMVWAVKDTVREHANTAREHARAVYEAGQAAADSVRGAASAIPTVAKAVAVGAIGLGAYVVVTRK